ncbi:MAG: ribosomal-protein-alanine N-acetyltransferase [Deltaproteobacteria bacterium RBG_13_47_9]|nr:MAG: ribosomal-protein-alanine N-acetyltransferase [Deltaproteobacteria bacterium RBG_13_47_9]
MNFERSALAIQRMEATDVDEIVTLEVTCSSDPWSRNMFLGEMSNLLSHCFVARGMDSPRVLGFICFRNVGEESDLLNICIHPQHRQRGIGKRLMEFYIDFCRRRDVKRYYLEVNSLNQPAIRLYRSLSYQSTGVRAKFYARTFDALLMMKEEQDG